MTDPNTQQPVRVEDLVPVASRVSWAAILAGATMALAAYFVLALLGTAIGLSVSDRASRETLSTGAAIYVIVASLLSLYFGGWVTTQITVGENKMEAAVHGVLTWGVVTAITLLMLVGGVRASYGGLAGLADVMRDTDSGRLENIARRVGVPVDDLKQRAENAPEKVGDAVRNPENQRLAREGATEGAWYALLGTILSIGAAVTGGLVGSGPEFRLFRGTGVARTTPLGGQTQRM